MAKEVTWGMVAEVDSMERFLDVMFPESYRTFLLRYQSAVVDGFALAGIPTEPVNHMVDWSEFLLEEPEDLSLKLDVVECTEFLREMRPDLPRNLVAVILAGTCATCLDLSRSNEADAPLVEVSLENESNPRDIGVTLHEWLGKHVAIEQRFRYEWKRMDNRQKEAGDKKRIQDWSAPIFRVKDYIIGIAAYRYSYRYACLEVDAFMPIDHPHVVKGSPVKVLLNEAMTRARDYCGSLTIQFTRNLSENDNGDMPDIEGNKGIRRVPTDVPPELVELAKSYGISIPHSSKGRIEHDTALALWFATLDLPSDVVARIMQIEQAGYLQLQVLAEVVSMSFWTRGEVTWLFQNAPRPEALIMGSDPPESRLSYAESVNYGRAALMATRFMYAIMAEMNGGFTIEDTEEVQVGCAVEPNGAFWNLSCTHSFYLPDIWLSDPPDDPEKRHWFKAGRPLLVLCRPHMPLDQEREIKRIEGYLQILLNAEEGRAGAAQAKCLVLSNEYISPYYCAYVDAVKEFVRLAERKGVWVAFAPTRTDLYVDQDIQSKMHQVRSMTQLPFRLEPKKLQIYAVPAECWKVPDKSSGNRAIQNASESAEVFANQLVKKRELRRHEMEFSLVCEVIEREASQHHELILEVGDEDSLDIMQALRFKRPALRGVSFSFVTPGEVPRFLNKLQRPELRRKLASVQGGIVILVRIWEDQFLIPTSSVHDKSHNVYTIPPGLLTLIDQRKQQRFADKSYASDRSEIERAHVILRDALAKGQPFSMASIRGRVRSHVFAESIIDYSYQNLAQGTVPYKLPIAYADGSRGGPFLLFSLREISAPDTSAFFEYNVGFISLRHSESDSRVDRFLVRNRDIQRRANSLQQEVLTYTKTYECLDELLRYIKGEIREDLASPSLQVLLGSRSELRARRWNGLKLNLFDSSGFEPGGIGAYRAVLDLVASYQGSFVVVPHIFSLGGKYKACQPWL